MKQGLAPRKRGIQVYLLGSNGRNGTEVEKESMVRTGERAAAKDDGADSANSLFIGNADVAALRFFLDGHFGDDGNSHARADHAKQAAELAAFENNLGMEARTIAGGDGGVAKAVAVAQ